MARRVLLGLMSALLATALLTACIPKNPHNLPVDHIVVLDAGEPLGRQLPRPAQRRGPARYEAEPTTGNPDPTNPSGPPIVPFHKTTYCESSDLNHCWNGTHQECTTARWTASPPRTQHSRRGSHDPSGGRTMGYYDQTDLPFYYGLYNTFATGTATSRRCCRRRSRTACTCSPERRSVIIRNDVIASTQQVDLQAARHTASSAWKIYADIPRLSYGSLFFKYVHDASAQHVFPISQYYADAAAGDAAQRFVRRPEVLATPRATKRRAPARRTSRSARSSSPT